jgi:threonine dehydratase
MIGIDDVRSAAAALDGVAHRTPVLSSRTLDAATGTTVFCKAECYQRGGAFKFRGAYSMISRVPSQERARGVAAYSSGNHAQAVAIAAALLDAPAVILMPEDAPAATAPRWSPMTATPRIATSSAASWPSRAALPWCLPTSTRW